MTPGGPPLETMQKLAPLIEESAAAHDEEATLCADVVDALHRHSLFHLLAPAAVGGSDVPARTAFEVIEEASRADGATGWSFMAGAIYLAAAGAFLPDAGAAKVFADSRSVIAGQVAPLGTALQAQGGWAVEGQFGFASGGLHATWFTGGFREQRDGAPVTLDNGLPSIVVGLFPTASVELQGNWDVVGLIGTGSIDYRVPPQALAPELSFPLFDPQQRRGHPRLRMGLAGLTCIGHSAFACGVGRRALDEIAHLAVTKRRFGRAHLIEDPLFQFSYARAEAQLTAARAFSLSALEALEATAEADAVTTEARTMARLAASHAAETGLEVASTVFRLSGSAGLRNGSAIQRCYRDMSAAEQHVFTDFSTYQDAGRLLLGVGPDTLLL